MSKKVSDGRGGFTRKASLKPASDTRLKHWLEISGVGLPGCNVEVFEDRNENNMPCGYAIGTILIAGCYMHLECIAVYTDDDGVHQAINQDFTSRVDALELEMDSQFELAEFAGKSWVIVATPHG